MRSVAKVIWQSVKIFTLFIFFTVLFYFALNWFNQEYQGLHKYDEPEGDAFKVFAPETDGDSMLDRLLLYYLDGE